jgi:hypothetical protein
MILTFNKWMLEFYQGEITIHYQPNAMEHYSWGSFPIKDGKIQWNALSNTNCFKIPPVVQAYFDRAYQMKAFL